MAILPWTLLGKNTTFQPDIGATPAELAFGADPRLPGDVAVSHDQPVDVPALLSDLRTKAAKKPAQTTVHSPPKPYFPPSAQEATHVYVKNQKRTPLDPVWDGPYPIEERVGKSCLKVRMGELAGGAPRIQMHHWANCQPADMAEGATVAQRPALGRKPKKAP